MTWKKKGPSNGLLMHIAKELGITEGAVRGALNRAFRKTRQNPEASEILRGYSTLDTDGARNVEGQGMRLLTGEPEIMKATGGGL